MTSIDFPSPRIVPAMAWRLPLPGIALSLLAVIYVIQFSSAWYYAGADALAADTQNIQPYGAPFRYLVWTSILSTTLIYFAVLPPRPFFQALAPFLLFWIMGFVSGFQGIAPMNSVIALTFWMLMACAAIVSGLATPPRLLIRTLAYSFGAIMALSILLAVGKPEVGQESGVDGVLWRGTFVFKTFLGYASMWALVIAFLAMPTVGRRNSAVLMLMAVTCLLFSGSKGSLAVAIAGFGYFGLLTILTRARLSLPVGAGVLIGGVLTGVVLVLYLWLPLTEALGKDATLTGRTVIWSTYLERVVQTPILGEGPTAFTSISTITEALFYQLSEWGAIRTPHNMYIAVFGDGGLVGLVLYVGGLFYLAFIAPFKMRSETSRACALAAFMILVGGTVETRGIYGSSLDFFVLFILRALAVKWDYVAAERVQPRMRPNPLAVAQAAA